MSGSSDTRRQWRDQATLMLRQIGIQRLDVHALFPNNEHLSSESASNEIVRDSLVKYFNKPLEGLVTLSDLGALLNRAPADLAHEDSTIIGHLRQLYQHAENIHKQVRDYVTGRRQDFFLARQLLGNIFQLGVVCQDSCKIKASVDESRRLETVLSTTHFSEEELTEFSNKLAREQGGQVDPFLANIIEEKKANCVVLNSRFMELLSKSSMNLQELRTICELVEQLNQHKVKVNHFRHICDLKDSFKWACTLDAFLDLPDANIDRLSEAMTRIGQAEASRINDLEKLKQKLTQFIEDLGHVSDLRVLSLMLDPLKTIELIDPNIQAIANLIKDSRWSIVARHKLNSKSLTLTELQELASLEGSGTTYIKILSLNQVLQQITKQLEELSYKLRDFLSEMDIEKITLQDSQVRLAELNKVFDAIKSECDSSLDCLPAVKTHRSYQSCEGMIGILNCSSIVNLKGSIKRYTLDQIDSFIGTDDDRHFRNHPLVQGVLDLMNEKKVVNEFLNMIKSFQPNEIGSLAGKMDIKTVKPYIEMIISENSPVDYEHDRVLVSELVERFNLWTNKVKELLQKYPLVHIETDYEVFTRELLPSFREEYNQILEEMSYLAFSSPESRQIQCIGWTLEALEFFHGKRRKRYEWQSLIAQGREVREYNPRLYARVAAEIESADHLKVIGHECYMEKVSYRKIRGLKHQVDNCRVDMQEEVAFFRDRLETEEDLYQRIDLILNNKQKLRMSELVRLSEDVKGSGIDFEEIGRKLESTIHFCKAFCTAVKDMKKEPKEIKKAKHIYSSLPLISSAFVAIIKQLEDEEAILDRLEQSFQKPDCLEQLETLTKLDLMLSQVKFYNVDRQKADLFKRKVSLIIQKTQGTPKDFTIPLTALKSMKNEGIVLAKKLESDEDLDAYVAYISDIVNDATKTVEMLAENRNHETLDSVSRVIKKFIDISQELMDIQAKMKLRISSMQESSTGRYIQPKNTRINLQVNVTGSRKFGLSVPLQPIQAPVSAKLTSKAEEDSKVDRPPRLSLSRTLRRTERKAEEDTGASAEGFDMRALRISLQVSLKYEIQRNPTFSENDSENQVLASNIEKAVFSKCLDGSYPQKMPQVVNLFQLLTKLRRLSTLLSRNRFNVDMILMLIGLPPALIRACETNKEMAAKIMQGYRYLSKRKPEQSSKEKEDKESLRLKSRKRKIRELERAYRYSSNREERSKIKRRLFHLMDQNGSGDGLKDIVIEGGRKHARDADGNSDESRDGQYRIKRKRSGERMERGHADNGHSKGSPNKGKDMQPAWSIFKGTMSFEVKSESSMEVCLDYSDLITLEEKDKVNSFPKLPHRIEFKGPVEHQEFMGQLNKMIRRQDKQLNFMLGFVQSSGNMEFLANIIAKPHAAFHVRLTKYTRLFIFHKSSYNKAWHEPLEVASKKIYQANSEYYWLLIYNIAAAEKADVHLPGIEPHPIYSQNLFKKRPDRDDDETTGRSEGLTGSHIFDSNQLRVKHGQHPPRLDEAGLSGKFGSSYDTAPRGIKAQAPSLLSKGSSLLNVLKYGAGHDEEMVKPSHSMYSGIPQYDHMGTEITPPLLSMSFNQQRPGQFDYSEYTARGRSNGAVPGMHQGAGHAHSNIHLGHHYDDETAGKGRMGTLRNHFEMSGQGMHQPPGLPIWTAQKIGADSFRGQLMMDERGGPGFLSKQGVAPPYRDHVSDMLFKTQGGKKPQQQQQQQPPPALMLSMLKKRKVQKVKQNVYQGNYQEVDTVSSLEEESTKKKAAYKLQKGKKMPTGLNSGSLKRSGDHQDSSGVHHANSASHNILNMKQSGPGGPSLTAPPSKSLNHGGSQKYHDFGARGLEQGMADASYRQAGGLGPNFLHSLSIKPGMMSLKSMAQSITQQYDPHSRIHDSQLHGGLGGPHTSNGSQAKNGNNGQQQYKWPNNY